METNFNFKSQICTTVAQSERLLALGLKKDTADMSSVRNLVETTSNRTREVIFTFTPDNWEANPDAIPRWSLHRLIEMIKDGAIRKDGTDENLSLDISGNGLYDGTIEAIEWLIKEGYFNKEYLV